MISSRLCRPLLVAGCIAFATVSLAADAPQIQSVRLGFHGQFKIGHWTPVWVTVAAGSQPLHGTLDITTSDGEGHPTCFTAPDETVHLAPGRETRVLRYVKLGRPHGGLDVRLLEATRVLASRTFRGQQLGQSLPSTQRMCVTLGRSIGVEEAAKQLTRGESETVATSLIDDVSELPDRWFGYEMVDTLVAPTSQAEPLASLSAEQWQALEQWVRLGGRLVLTVGARGEEVFGPVSRLKVFAPGTEVSVVSTRKVSGLESYCGAAQPVSVGRGVPMTAISGPRGQVDAFEGLGGANEHPAIVRSRLGLGQVVFVAFDLDAPPFDAWRDRPRLVARLLEGSQQRRQNTEDERQRSQIVHVGYRDIVGQLRGSLDQFPAVRQVSFSLVALLIVAYIALIGPGDYFVLSRLLRRMHWMWLTFPAIVIGFCWLAYSLEGRWRGGGRLLVNQVDLVDIDAASGLARGTTWAHVYSPRSEGFDLALDVCLAPAPLGGAAAPLGGAAERTGMLLAWQGLPGTGLGGLEAGPGAAFGRTPYSIVSRVSADGAFQTTLSDLPIQVSSTRSLVARWWTTTNVSATTNANTESQLTVGAAGLLDGTLENPLPIKLTDCSVFYENWLYRLNKPLPPGAVIRAQDQRALNLVWQLQRKSVVELSDLTTPWNETKLDDVPRLLEIMLFHQAAGGPSYTRLTHRYQPYLDFSEQVRSGSAVLMGWSDQPASHLTRDGQPLVEQYDRRWTLYRIVYPVRNGERNMGIAN